MKGSQWSHTCLAGCHSGPIDAPRTYSQVITETEDTRLGREVAAWQQSHPGVSGFYPVVQRTDGLGARLALIDRAERTIDAQYFLIKSDTMGFIPVSVDFVRFRQ